MAESFLKNNQNKKELNKYLSLKLFKIHQSDQIMISTYTNTLLCSPPSCSELDTLVVVRPCEVQETDQRLARHALNLISHGYKNILVPTIDTDVLVLFILNIGQVELNDREIHAYLINPDKYYHIKQIIQELGSNTFVTLPFFHTFTGCDKVSSFYGKGKCKAYDV